MKASTTALATFVFSAILPVVVTGDETGRVLHELLRRGNEEKENRADGRSRKEPSLRSTDRQLGYYKDDYKKDKKEEKESKCGECQHEVFYHYADASNAAYFHGRFVQSKPQRCKLAAIRDHESRVGAQYAIPEGKIAITQGYFPLAQYKKWCHFDYEKTINGTVTGCYDPYPTYFINYEGTHVPDDYHIWDVPHYPFDDGVLNVGIGADGILRPVKQILSGVTQDDDQFGFDGAVYECCPTSADDICNVELPVDDGNA